MRVRRAPLATQLTMLVGLTLLIALILAEAVNAVTDVRAFREGMAREASQVARVVGRYSIADLHFGTSEDAERTLAGLAEDPTLLAAVLYDREGERFAQFRRPQHTEPLPERRGPAGGSSEQFEDTWLEVARDIQLDGERVGTIVLRISTEPLDRRVRQHLVTAGLMTVVLFALSAGVALVVQRAIIRPIEGLTAAAQWVAQSGERSVRFRTEAAPEIEVLADAFDHMLTALDRELREREAAEAAQRRYAERLSLLHELERAMITGAPLAEIARRALASVEVTAKCDCACVFEIDEPAAEGRLLACEPSREGAPERFAIADADVARMRRDDAWTAPIGLCPIPLPHAPTIDALLVVPMRSGPDLLGAMVLGVAPTRTLDDEAVTIAQELAGLVALAIHQARLAEQIARHTAELEQRVEDRTAELAQTNRELEAFGYSVAHDLRAPLRAMSGFAEALLADHADRLDPEARGHLDRIVAAARRMDLLIRDLLEYSRLTLQEVSPVRLSVDDAVARARADLELVLADADVTVDAPLGEVTGHAGIVEQVLANLLSNAAKFVKPGQRPSIRVRAEPRGERLRVWVEDQGIGIAPDHYDRIFRVFERLHAADAYPGTGIGLAIVKRGIERLGGAVGVESQPGEGSRFWFELPAPPTRRAG